MEKEDVQQQVLIEHQTLGHVTSALRTTLDWESHEEDFSRKLSSLQFVTDSFERHLKRLFKLEQAEGYMAVVLEARPEMTEDVRALRAEHVQFQKDVAGILARLNEVDSTDHAAFSKICDDTVALLNRLDKHHRKETGLLQEALLRDEGGEG